MEDLLSNAKFLNKISGDIFSKDSKEAMDKFGYVVIWDKEISGVIKLYKDGRKVRLKNK